MKIMVFGVPAESGGALTILNQYYNSALRDLENEWLFVVSLPELQDSSNVKILKFPWIKKSWIHRLIFDYLIASKIVKKYSVDEVLSLQNVLIPNVNVKQKLYLHQPLPFVEKRYKVTENFKFWIYQNVIGQLIYKSIKEADQVIVQTKWIMEACIDKLGVNRDKFKLEHPVPNIFIQKYYSPEQTDTLRFFYPSSGMEYKNHKVILEALKYLPQEYLERCEVVLTLTENENGNTKKISSHIKADLLPVKFVGHLTIEEVYDYYSKTILIFPSYIETFGLPLLEAKLHNCPIIASNCAFSHEILDGYEEANFFDPFNPEELAYLIIKEINKRNSQ